MDEKRQIKYNKCLEETSGLLLEISNIILMDFSNYISRFSSLEKPSKKRLIDYEVKNEETNFFYNIKLFDDCFLFTKGCFEIYSILIKQIDDMFIPENLNERLIQFLSRARLNSSNLIFTAKNTLSNIKFDKKLCLKRIENCAEINKREMEKSPKNYNFNAAIKKPKMKAPLPKFDKESEKVNSEKYVDLTEKIRRQFIFKLNEETQRKMRLNGILNR